METHDPSPSLLVTRPLEHIRHSKSSPWIRSTTQRIHRSNKGTQVVEQVSKNINGIGYVGLAYAKSEGIFSVKVDGVDATPENADEYPLSRNLYYYTIGEPAGEAKKFLDWATTSKTASKIITKVGFIPSGK